MGLFSIFGIRDIDAGVEKFKNTEGGVLIDVRTEEEYARGHIENSINLPLSEISAVGEIIPVKIRRYLFTAVAAQEVRLRRESLKRWVTATL